MVTWPLAGMCGTSFLQASGFGFTDEEKDDGITMSVVSSEGVKSPPNGDHVEAQAAQIACPPMPGGPSDMFYIRQPAGEGRGQNGCTWLLGRS